MDQRENLKSINSQDPAFVRFINNTQCVVDIIWINYTGAYIKYRLLYKGAYVDINTFKTHPWIALDHQTKDRLHINKQLVYFPKTSKDYLIDRLPNITRCYAIITLPVYSLRYRTILEIRNLLRQPEDVDNLSLPKELINDLKRAIIQKNNQLKQLISDSNI